MLEVEVASLQVRVVLGGGWLSCTKLDAQYFVCVVVVCVEHMSGGGMLEVASLHGVTDLAVNKQNLHAC
jgi:hypothetical protein